MTLLIATKNTLHDAIKRELGGKMSKESKLAVVLAVPGIYLGGLLLLTLIPIKSFLEVPRSCRWFFDLLFLCMCAALSQAVGDATSTVVVFMICAHIIPVSGLVRVFENLVYLMVSSR
ncbi:hypothetical protein ABFS83_03G053900 [Erythranthe nasuta]